MRYKILNTELQTPSDHGIFDSGTNGHFLLPNTPMINKQSITNPLCITLPECYTIASTRTCLLDIPQIPATARLAHMVPYLAHSSLISVKQICDERCRVECDATNCYVYFNNNIIIHGQRDEKTKVWTLPKQTNPTPTQNKKA